MKPWVPDIPRMLKWLVGLIVALAGGWGVCLLVAGYGCVPVSGNKGIDLSKDQSVAVATPVSVGGDVSGGLTVVNIAGGTGCCALLLAAVGLYLRQRTAIRLVDRMAGSIKDKETTFDAAQQIKNTGFWVKGVTKYYDAPERLLRKRLKKL